MSLGGGGGGAQQLQRRQWVAEARRLAGLMPVQPGEGWLVEEGGKEEVEGRGVGVPAGRRGQW